MIRSVGARPVPMEGRSPLRRGRNTVVDAHPCKTRLSWKTLFPIVATCAFLWAALRRVRGTELVQALAGADVRWLTAALALFGLAGLLVAARLHLMLSLTGADIHPGATIRLSYIGRFFNLLLFGPAAGDLARSALYSRWYGVSLPKVIAAAPLDRLLGLAGLLVLVGVGAVVGGATGAFSGLLEGWIRLGAAALGLAAVIVFLMTRLSAASAVGQLWSHIREAVRQLWRHPRRAILGLILGFLVHVCMGAVLAACLTAVSPEALSFLGMIWVFLAISILTSAPSVAGVGVREAAAMALLGLYGVSGANAVAASLLYAVCHVMWAALGGLWLWRESVLKARVSPPGEAATLSVVIPTWNEAEALPETLERLQRIPEVLETIIVDGGSSDETLELARRAGCRVVESEAGRGRQLRAGAAVATGDVVLMLHADTWLEADAGAAALRCLRDPVVVGGGFWKDFRDGTWLMAGSRWRCAPRLFLFRRVLGDQGIFVRREILEGIGGVPDLPLMEEFRLCELLNRRGRLALAGSTALTSARRFRKLGPLRTYFRMWRVTVLYHLGVKPEVLKGIYEKG